MTTGNTLHKNMSRISKGGYKLKKGLLTLAIAGTLSGALQSCNTEDTGYGKGNTIEQKDVQTLRDSFMQEYNQYWAKFYTNNESGHKISEGPVLVKRGTNYSIFITMQNIVGAKTISQVYDNGDIGFSYYYTPYFGLEGINTADGVKTLKTTKEYQDAYTQLLEIFTEANGK